MILMENLKQFRDSILGKCTQMKDQTNMLANTQSINGPKTKSVQWKIIHMVGNNERVAEQEVRLLLLSRFSRVRPCATP